MIILNYKKPVLLPEKKKKSCKVNKLRKQTMLKQAPFFF